MRLVSFIIIIVFLSGCTFFGGNNPANQSPSSSVSSDAGDTNSVPGPSVNSSDTAIPATFNADQAIHIGHSDHGTIYESFGHLYIVGADQQAAEIGDPATLKRGAKLSDDGSVLVYQFLNMEVIDSPLTLALHAIDTGKVTVLDTQPYLPTLGAYFWAGDQVLIQEAAFSPAPKFVMYSGSTGEKTWRGQVFQSIMESGNKISYLLRFDPPEDLSSIVNYDNIVTISLLTSEGVLHTLLEQSVYETQYLDIRLSDDHSAIAVWSHQVPSNSSNLFIASVDPSSWKVGEWQSYDTASKQEGFIRFYTDRQIVLLSNEQSFRLPPPLAEPAS
ncbi:hypothetical protein [Paenibacillus paeoniae]|uniref:Uncharacterized protein n=1 Tax=Paenibacillus paeoniae TaxID=2292705 RepID=A0A371PJ55_9BACL|nr:hypothetical protein [Paenibacillus paeoniae]REK76204.1 hypothetical protein DX130_03865 [Paenibacillus paeoniae]